MLRREEVIIRVLHRGGGRVAERRLMKLTLGLDKRHLKKARRLNQRVQVGTITSAGYRRYRNEPSPLLHQREQDEPGGFTVAVSRLSRRRRF